MKVCSCRGFIPNLVNRINYATRVSLANRSNKTAKSSHDCEESVGIFAKPRTIIGHGKFSRGPIHQPSPSKPVTETVHRGAPPAAELPHSRFVKPESERSRRVSAPHK